MPLPEQLADIARELARRGHETTDAPTYTAGVRDTLVLVGELLRLSASGLPRDGREPRRGAQSTADHLRRLAYELDRLLSADSATPTPGAMSPRVRFDLSRAQQLLTDAATELASSRPLVAVSATEPSDTTPEGEVGGRSTWLAAFALALARQAGSDERDVRDLVRLSGDDRQVLAAAARRVETAPQIEPEQRQRARQLFARADALARGQERTATR